MTGSEMNKLTITTMQVEALRKQLADAQATVEALQRERDEAKASEDMWKREAYLIGDALRPLCGLSEYEFGWKPAVKIIADKLAALDAEREKVRGLAQQVQDQSTANLETMRHTDDMQSRALDAERALAQLQALVRALPVVEGRIEYVNGRGWVVVTPGDVRALPELGKGLVAALLTYRAALDATTPAVCPDCNGEGAVDSGGTDPSGNPLMRRCGCREKGGDGEPAECTNHFTDGSKIFPSRNCCSKGGDGE